MELITDQRLRQTLKLLKVFLIIGMICSVFFILGILSLITYAKVQGAPPLAVPQTTIYYGNDGTIIGESNSGQNRYWVTLDQISPAVIDATIAVEDRKFFDHHGFDYKRIVGALIADIKAMAKVQGASTITQQYARNLFLDHDKTWKRKFYEALYTLRLEMNYSKEQILEGYLNTIYYGHGAYGIEAAANIYFNKHAEDLTLSEATILAGIPKAPSYYSPFKDFDKSKQRQRIVLHAMVKNGDLNPNEVSNVYQKQLAFAKDRTISRPDIAPYFQDVVKNKLTDKIHIKERVLEMGGLRVYTTLDPALQNIAENQVKTVIDPESKIQVALASIDPATGEVRALVGGRNYDESPYNRAVQAERMPGSTFKPFLYYSALEKGFTPSTTMISEPKNFIYDHGREIYRPSNYNNYYANDFITMAQGLALSDNIFAVKTHMFLGTDVLKENAKEKFGITSDLLAVPSLALGTSSVKMIDMVNAYGRLANGGKGIEPVFITKVVNHKGEVIYEYEPNENQVLDKNKAFVTTHMMTGMFDPRLNDYTTVTGSTILNKLTRPYAGKSGTTQTDNWMIGFSPQLVTGVWIGYDKGKTIDLVKERRYAKQIWSGYMEAAHQGLPVMAFKPPEGVTGVYVNPNNGKLATNSCPVRRLTYYETGTEPTVYCTDHINIHENKRIIPKTREEEEEKGLLKKFLDWLS